jgi:hypothetical protein
MSKAKRLRELCNSIKKEYNLDSVTAVSSKSQYKNAGLPHDPTKVYFKMRYTLKSEDDVLQLCPITWATINANVDDYIVKVCGEMLSSHEVIKPLVQQMLSGMAQNAVKRASNG